MKTKLVHKYAEKLGIRRKGKVSILGILFLALIFPPAATYLHEMGHVIALRLLGCEAYTPTVYYYFGATPYNCSQPLSPLGWAVAAYAGPFTALLIGLLAWFYNKDSLLRLFALFLFFYGFLPNLVWQMKGTDAYYAVAHGFDPFAAQIIMYGGLVLVLYLVAKEVMEDE